MHSFSTVNPKDRTVIANYEFMTEAAADQIMSKSLAAFHLWRGTPLSERTAALARLADLLIAEAPRLSALATTEMGKPVTQARKEVEKCALACRYYAEHAAAMLADEEVTANPKGYIAYRPLGPVLCIMPWNFPYWQVIRFAAPALAAGNTVILKHAENTTGVALEIERLFTRAAFVPHALQTLILGHAALERVIQDARVCAVTLTGSERAGRAVAGAAGAALKKSVLELGGSDAYIILRDADLGHAAAVAAQARLVNNGQSCVAAKRFIIEADVYDAFTSAFIAEVQKKKVGDPLDPATDVGPLAKQSIWEDVAAQTASSIQQGARVLLGGKPDPASPGYYYPPTVLGGVTPGMRAFDEEVFGPVAAMVRAKDATAALTLANQSRFGLGGAIFSRDVRRAEELAARHLEAGFCVVNGMVQSDPRLPFGGIKSSGYGRELGTVGLREFVNTKTVVVY